MKCTIPEISWHNRDPVLSADIQSSQSGKNLYRLATGGTDSHILIWQLIILENGGVSVEILSDLTRHTRAVNCVRFSPSGEILASSDDDAAIILWKKNENSNDIFIEENENDNKEHWSVLKLLRSHIEDVYDLCWSSCSQFLFSGSVDNSAILWDIHKGKNKFILKDHKGFVQGVSYDPQGQLLATLSSDRVLRIYSLKEDKIKLISRVYKTSLPSSDSGENQRCTRLFHDDTLKSFCRRLSFSPDGELLVAPSGILEEVDGKSTNTVYLFLRTCLHRPVMCFPTQDKYTIAVRFCPLMFELKKFKNSDDDDPESQPYTELFDLPYRMIFAVATQNAVLIFDTQQPIPFAKVSNIHYTRLSDVSWSSDGKILIVSSTDGYCSLISFAEGELGTPYVPPEEVKPTPANDVNLTDKELIDDVEAMAVGDTQSSQGTSKTEKVEDDRCSAQKPSVPIETKRKSGKRVQLITLSKTVEVSNKLLSPPSKEVRNEDTEDSSIKNLCASSTSDNDEALGSEKNCTPSRKVPRRIPLITLSSPKSNSKTKNT